MLFSHYFHEHVLSAWLRGRKRIEWKTDQVPARGEYAQSWMTTHSQGKGWQKSVCLGRAQVHPLCRTVGEIKIWRLSTGELLGGHGQKMLSRDPEVQGTGRSWCGHLKRGSYREGREECRWGWEGWGQRLKDLRDSVPGTMIFEELSSKTYVLWLAPWQGDVLGQFVSLSATDSLDSFSALRVLLCTAMIFSGILGL